MPNDYKYDKREITHGAQNYAYAPMVEKEGKIDTEQEMKSLTGVIGSNFETSQESSQIYADNQVHMTLYGNVTVEGTLNMYQFPKDFVLNHMGKEETTNGGLIDGGAKAPFILQKVEIVNYETGEERRKLTVYYNVTAGVATGEEATDEDSVEGKEYELPLTVAPNNLVTNSKGQGVTSLEILETEENKDLIDYAMTHIILPDTTTESIKSSFLE